jgi:hypothetical protein
VLKTSGFRREKHLEPFRRVRPLQLPWWGELSGAYRNPPSERCLTSPQMGPSVLGAAREWRFIAPVVWLIAGHRGLGEFGNPCVRRFPKGHRRGTSSHRLRQTYGNSDQL